VQKLINFFSMIGRQRRSYMLAGVVLLVVAGWLLWNRGGEPSGKAPAFAARRGPLEITVLEGGSLQALESQEIKCEVRVGYQGTKILKIVEEGYFVSEDDIKTNKVLVELDSSELQKQIVQQEISCQSALATLINAQQNYEIQLSQNASDVKGAEQKARFARMDFDKFLGDTVTTRIIEEVGLDKLFAAASTNNVEQTTRAQEATQEKKPEAAGQPTNGGPLAISASATPLLPTAIEGIPMVASPAGSNSVPPSPAVADSAAAEPDRSESDLTNNIKVDFSKYAELDKLGDGEAKQKLRKFYDDLQGSQKELGQAKTKVEGTQRLFAKGFVTKAEMEGDEISFENYRLKVQQAESARDLFLKYDFVKSAEESLSKYAEAVRELDKARRVAISKLAQARANLKSAQGQHQVQSRQLKDFNEQLEKCTLQAKKSGLVVYGSAGEDMFYYGGEERIREGATVRERQAIITIPDMSRMSVKVKIHESYIKKIKKGLKARVTVDAFPDKVLAGEVTKVGVLPDSQNRWMNPDMKVYLTTITLDGTQDWVKPGMSAKVEILVNKIENCIYVPVQAVSPDGDKQVCFLSGLKPVRREVQIGEFNDEFIEVKAGLAEGERVLLRRPDGGENEKAGSERKAPAADKARPEAPATVPAVSPVQAAKT
jgi:HlyD family secretion protein